MVLAASAVLTANVQDVKASASAPGQVSKYVLFRHEISLSVICES